MPSPPWVHRLALSTAGATLLLIVAGGLVTNTGAALAVPDWPTTFGHNPFLFPWSRMVGGILVEHGHRLLGAAVGLLTVGLGVSLWLSRAPGWLRALGIVAVGLVSFQGLLGGLRVVLRQDTLAIVHGCLAQAFFALTVALMVFTTSDWAAPAPALVARDARRLVGLSLGVAATLYGQVVLGALTTHGGWARVHVAGAVVVVLGVAGLVGRIWARHAADLGLVRRARVVGVLLGLQVGLGLGAYVTRFTGLGMPGGEVAVIGLPVVHRAVGALLLGAMLTLVLEAWRRCPSARREGARMGPMDADAGRGRVPA